MVSDLFSGGFDESVLPRHNGFLVVIEGIDGSGKGTQFNNLKEWLSAGGVLFKTADFPRYEDPSSYFVSEYLRGSYGSSVGWEVASLFYALDRFDASEKWMKSFLEGGGLILSNRYVTSNIGHQGGKASPEDRPLVIDAIKRLEYGLLSIPKPDLVIYLDINPFVAQQLVDLKNQRSYLAPGRKRDIHEADVDHLRNAREAYLLESSRDDSWVVIDCLKDGLDESVLLDPSVSPLDKVRSLAEIFEDIKRVFSAKVDLSSFKNP